MDKTDLQIGEFSRLCGVTVKTLRHYEKLGLLLPVEVDSFTGYRYYRTSQLQQMQTILHLKEVGFSLEEIGELMDSECQTPDQDLLLAKIRQTEAQLQTLVLRRDRLVSMTDSRQKIIDMKNITIQSLPSVAVASYRTSIPSYQDLGALCVNTIAPEMARAGCRCHEPGYCFTIEHSEGYTDHDIDIEYCEAVEGPFVESESLKYKVLPEVPMAECVKCHGPYERLYQHYVDAFAHVAKEGYKVSGAPRACYVDGIWNQADPEKWLTILQIPVMRQEPAKVVPSNRLKLYCCPECGSVAAAYGNAVPQCCGQMLVALPIKKMDADERPSVSDVDGQVYLEYKHPMTKQFYIAAVVVERYDRVCILRLFPEQEASVYIDQLRGAKVYTVYRRGREVWASVM